MEVLDVVCWRIRLQIYLYICAILLAEIRKWWRNPARGAMFEVGGYVKFTKRKKLES